MPTHKNDTSNNLFGSMGWLGHEVVEHIVSLNDADRAEIKSALNTWKDGKNADPSTISKDTFPLPTVGPRLEGIARNVHCGNGFSVLRGLDTKSYGPEDNLLIYLGVSSYVGSKRGAQNKKRDMVTHITDAKEWSDVPQEKRHGIHTNSALPFHNDMGCEILALHYRDLAQDGGATSLAPAATALSILSASNPDHLRELLVADWPVQLTGGDKPTFARLRLAGSCHGRFMTSVDPGRLGLHPATAGQRDGEDERKDFALTEEQLGAVESLSSAAEACAYRVEAQQGDVLYVNNFALLHKREAYADAEGEDAEEGGARRHVVRLWLRNLELAWDIPEHMKGPWNAAYGSRTRPGRDSVGRLLELTEDRYQVVPEKEYKVPRYSSGSAAWLIDADEE